MSTVEPEPDRARTELVDEVHELEEQAAALERRTRSLELAGPLALFFSLFALALGAGAFIVALSNRSDNTLGSTTGGVATSGNGQAAVRTGGMMMGSSGTASGGTMMGAGGHGRFSSAQVAAAKHGTIFVQLGDYWAAPTVSSIRAGKVTFVARNVGRVPHELMVERMPMRFDSPMHPNEDAAQGMIDDMGPGHGGRMTMHLRPGRFMLFCNAPGHYAAGQHMMFTVRS